MPRTPRRILAFPQAGNIYTEQLYEEVVRRGVTVMDGTWSAAWLLRHVRRGDIVHIHWPSFLYFEPNSRLRTAVRLAKMVGILALARLRGADIVWTAHNLYPHEGNAGLLAHRLGRRIVLAFADRVIVHGASAAVIVGREFNIPHSRLLIGRHPHWIDLYANTMTRAQSRAHFGLTDEFLYLHIGRCMPYKGLEALIEAFAAVPAPARLLIAGHFPSLRYLEEITALARRTPRVDVIPRSIPDEEMQMYLNAADCVVLPYRAILTSGTALLALSFGCPVIAPNMGSMRDHVHPRSGTLYDAGHPHGLAQALLDVRCQSFDPAAIRDRVRDFSWSSMADLLLEGDGRAVHVQRRGSTDIATDPGPRRSYDP